MTAGSKAGAMPALARTRWAPGLAGLWVVLACAGCDLEPGATASPVAPGRPGTGNPAVVLAPAAESPTESPQIGGARALVPPAVTGKPAGRRAAGPHPVFDLPGVGLDGGLGHAAARA